MKGGCRLLARSALVGTIAFAEVNQLWLLVEMLLEHSAAAGVTFTRRRGAGVHGGDGMMAPAAAAAAPGWDGGGAMDGDGSSEALSGEELCAAHWHYGEPHVFGPKVWADHARWLWSTGAEGCSTTWCQSMPWGCL